MEQDERNAAIEAIGRDIEREDLTPELRAQATSLVMGSGSTAAKVVFIGEAPGKQEDLSGRPFVGASGKLLDELLASIGLDRADVYITNIVKYRPPANRDPSKSEIIAFIPYLDRQLDIIKPRIIVFLGRHAMNVFLPDLTIGDAHGVPVIQENRVLIPLYHPAAALYNGGMRQTLMDDFAVIRQVLENPKTP